jgi:hypothetical protein
VLFLLVPIIRLPAQGSRVEESATPPRYRAQPAASAVRIDGRLDEAAWSAAGSAGDFRQVEPEPLAPARFPTRVRVVFDEHNLYLGIVALDSAGSRGVRVQDLRREFDYFANDLVGVSLDPLHDGRTAIAFQVTPYGSLRDLQVFDDQVYNREWEGVWTARTEVSDSGWTVEIAIPWATLRYRDDAEPWGVNFYRIARRANETSAWSPWPRAYTAYRAGYFGVLEGLKTPPPRRNLRVRPYFTGETVREGAGDPTLGQRKVRAGGEMIWAPGTNTVLEATVNTDFAQADVDRQVVNLSRFSVFFPERRQFFLESANLFSVGLTESNSDYVIEPFFSRRIGLADDGATIPIRGGLRLVQRGARSSIGALAIHQDAAGGAGAATFGVIRASRNVGRASRVGLLLGSRLDGGPGVQPDTTSAMAAVDWFARFGEVSALEGMVSGATSSVPGGEGLAGYTRLTRSTNTLTTRFTTALTTRDYRPPTGFVSRGNVLMVGPEAEYDWRPGWKPRALRRFYGYLGSFVYLTPASLSLQETVTATYLDIMFQSGALIYPELIHYYQNLTEPFSPVPGVVISPGEYSYVRPDFYFGTDPSRRFSASANLFSGPYYDRSLDQVELTTRYAPSPHVTAQIDYTWNRFHGLGSSVTAHLLGTQLRLALTPRLQVTTFYQYSSSGGDGVLNARLAWEFLPLSYVFLVLNDRRAAGPNGSTIGPAEPRQQLLLKLQYLGQL